MTKINKNIFYSFSNQVSSGKRLFIAKTVYTYEKTKSVALPVFQGLLVIVLSVAAAIEKPVKVLAYKGKILKNSNSYCWESSLRLLHHLISSVKTPSDPFESVTAQLSKLKEIREKVRVIVEASQSLYLNPAKQSQVDEQRKRIQSLKDGIAKRKISISQMQKRKTQIVAGTTTVIPEGNTLISYQTTNEQIVGLRHEISIGLSQKLKIERARLQKEIAANQKRINDRTKHEKESADRKATSQGDQGIWGAFTTFVEETAQSVSNSVEDFYNGAPLEDLIEQKQGLLKTIVSRYQVEESRLNKLLVTEEARFDRLKKKIKDQEIARLSLNITMLQDRNIREGKQLVALKISSRFLDRKIKKENQRLVQHQKELSDLYTPCQNYSFLTGFSLKLSAEEQLKTLDGLIKSSMQQNGLGIEASLKSASSTFGAIHLQQVNDALKKSIVTLSEFEKVSVDIDKHHINKIFFRTTAKGFRGQSVLNLFLKAAIGFHIREADHEIDQEIYSSMGEKLAAQRDFIIESDTQVSDRFQLIKYQMINDPSNPSLPKRGILTVAGEVSTSYALTLSILQKAFSKVSIVKSDLGDRMINGQMKPHFTLEIASVGP